MKVSDANSAVFSNLHDYLDDRDSTRRRALDAAARMFRARGFAAVSMSEIAQEVGLSKPGLYHHWPSKEALLQAIVRLSGEVLLGHLESVLTSEQDPVARLRAYVVTRLQTVAEYQDFFIVMWQERTTVGTAGFSEMASRAEQYRSRIRALIEDAKRAKGLREGIDTQLLMLALDGMTGWAYFWYRPGRGKGPIAIGEEFWEMLSAGILSDPKG